MFSALPSFGSHGLDKFLTHGPLPSMVGCLPCQDIMGDGGKVANVFLHERQEAPWPLLQSSHHTTFLPLEIWR
jgi:hypothetical protein